MTVPQTLIAGDTWQWDTELEDYPAPAWTLAWYFENKDGNFTVATAAEGTAHRATLSAGESALIKPGGYLARATVHNGDGGERYTVVDGAWITVKPDPGAATNIDHRSHARRVVEMIEAYLEDPTNVAASSYSLGGRSLSRWSRADLRVELDKYRREIAFEDRGVKARRYYVRTSRA